MKEKISQKELEDKGWECILTLEKKIKLFKKERQRLFWSTKEQEVIFTYMRNQSS